MPSLRDVRLPPSIKGARREKAGAMRLNRAEVVQDVVHVLLTAGVLFSLPVLTWVLGIY